MRALTRAFPDHIDNRYRGQPLALWLFGLVAFVRTTQSLLIIFDGASTITRADGVPLDTYPPGAAQTIVAMFALSSVNRLVIALLCVVVLVRYRSAVPFMFAVLAMSFLASQLVTRLVPIERVGAPPATIVNLVIFSMILVGLALSLWKRKAAQP